MSIVFILDYLVFTACALESKTPSSKVGRSQQDKFGLILPVLDVMRRGKTITRQCNSFRSFAICVRDRTYQCVDKVGTKHDVV